MTIAIKLPWMPHVPLMAQKIRANGRSCASFSLMITTLQRRVRKGHRPVVKKQSKPYIPKSKPNHSFDFSENKPFSDSFEKCHYFNFREVVQKIVKITHDFGHRI